MARDTSKLVTIPGELHSAATGNIVAAAEEVFDYTTNKYQKDINQEVAYIKEDSSVAPIPSFNPQSQTVHLDEQVLSNVQKKQVRKNIGLGNGDIDSAPTSGSDNVVRSGGVYSSMQELHSTVNQQVGYYTCSTAGNIAAKIIDASGYTLFKGGGLHVNFIEKNTAANATLNIEQTGAKPLYYNGVRVSTNNSWYAGEIMTLFYDGAAFQLNSLPDLDEYDVSARNGGQAFTFEEAVALVPEAYRHGGLKLRFISNSDSSISDNKYVQYRLMSTSFSTNKADWQGVDDKPTAGSDNLVKSGGVANAIEAETARATAAEKANAQTINALSDEIYKREVMINSYTSLDHPIDIKIQDNKYYDAQFKQQESANYNCFKVDVTNRRNRYVLLDAYCFGFGYAAKSAITDKDNNVIRYVSNEGILPKYIFIPNNAKYLYVSNRKYKDLQFDYTGSAVKSVSVPKMYEVYTSPTLLDTRHFAEIERKNSNKYFHFSLDDFKDAIADIVANSTTYNSIFDNSTFAKLREWHEKYGIVVSLYLQRTMSDVPTKFRNDFIYNSDWMKLGYHGTGTLWETATYENGKQWWNDFINGIMKSIGDYNVIDRVPRNDYFHGTLESCKGERDANCGCIGFLGCDDWSYNAETRGTNYYLTNEQSIYLDARDRYYDYENQLCIFKTDFRLEQIKERWGTVNNCLNFYKSANAATQAFDLIVFSHEWNFMTYKTEAETIFKWARKNGYRFDFPMNVLLR